MLVPTTAAGHRFWEENDPDRRGHQRAHFLKNAAILGGLLVATGDTAGMPSLAWRGSHGVKCARRDLRSSARAARVPARAGLLRLARSGGQILLPHGRRSTLGEPEPQAFRVSASAQAAVTRP